MPNYLTFSSPSTFTLNVVNNKKYWDGTLYYSTDTTTWNTWSGTSAISSSSSGTTKYLYLRGSGNTYITGSSASSSRACWVLTGSNISCDGNIENLLDYQTVALGNHPTMANYCYLRMFRGCTALTTAPTLPATTLTNGCYSNMFYNCTSLTTAPELPATTMVNSCYYYMFYGCSNLTTAPELQATTLAYSCYYGIFYGCTNLTTTPSLPATTLVDYCYQNMFYGCSKIKLSTTQTGEYTQTYRIPTSESGTTATDALTNMFTNTGGTFTGTPEINTTYYLSNTNTIIPSIQPEPTPTEIKNIWANTNQIAKAFLGSSEISKIYLGSTLIYSSSAEPEPQPVAEPYLTFSSPSSFTLKVVDNIKYWDGTLYYSTDTTTWNTWSGTSAISSSSSGTTKYLYLRGSNNTIITGSGVTSTKAHWVLGGSNISCSGNIENLLDYQTVTNGNHPTMANYCYYGMFQNCVGLTTAPALPATTLANYCYSNMFNSCTSLTTAPSLPATALANYCYESMFFGCSSLTTAPALPAKTLATNCYSSMFYGCTALTTAPALPATTLANYCYYYMFYNCSSLTTAPALPATTLTKYCYQYMFYGCTSLTTPAIMAGGTTQATPAKNCCNWMYYGCTALNIYTSSSNHTAFYKALTYSTTSSNTNYRSSYQMFYNCYIDGAKSTIDYLIAGTQYYY